MLLSRRRCLFLACVAILVFLMSIQSLQSNSKYVERYVDSYAISAIYNSEPFTYKYEPFTEGKGTAYKSRLQHAANQNNVVILAMIDKGFVDVVINFWEISIRPFHIKNMLFVSLSRTACVTLASRNIPCHVYENFTGGEDDSAYMSPIFLRKMNTRTQFLLDALSWNFSVLNTDTDVIFFQNPLAHFNCTDCHLEILEDGEPNHLNAGFVFLRPSNTTGNLNVDNLKSILVHCSKNIMEHIC